jgi:hypothetical protein
MAINKIFYIIKEMEDWTRGHPGIAPLPPVFGKGKDVGPDMIPRQILTSGDKKKLLSEIEGRTGNALKESELPNYRGDGGKKGRKSKRRKKKVTKRVVKKNSSKKKRISKKNSSKKKRISRRKNMKRRLSNKRSFK